MGPLLIKLGLSVGALLTIFGGFAWYLAETRGYDVGKTAIVVAVVIGLATIPLGGIGFAILIIVGLCILLGPIGLVAAVVGLAAIAMIKRQR